MNEGKSKKDNNSSNSVAVDKRRRTGIMSAAVLSLAAFLILATVQSSPHGASAAGEQAAKIINNNNNVAAAAKQHRQYQQYWQDFLKLEKESWHYDYGKAEKQNIKAYQKWYCADLHSHGYKDFTHACDRSAYPRDAMWQHEQLRDEMLWNKANHQPHHEIKKTDEQLKYLHKRTGMRDSMIQHSKAGDMIWRHYLSLEKQAWHYDYAKTGQQNFQTFHKWWNRGGVEKGPEKADKIWFSEQYGHEILWNKATANKGDSGNGSNKGHMQSWFEEAYRQHKAEIARNKCVNPWERTPSNAAPLWSACLDVKGSSAR
ncbi:MAG: hypothetical protein ABI348_08340 [Nitrososphaera sp.]